jgi:hypothetical protein
MIERRTVEAIFQRNASYFSLNLSLLTLTLLLLSFIPKTFIFNHVFHSTFYHFYKAIFFLHPLQKGQGARLGSFEEQKEYIGRFPLFLISSYFPPPFLSQKLALAALYLLHRENKLRGRKVGEKRKKSVGIL